MALRDRIPFFAGLSSPMLGLLVLAVFRALREPFDPQIWSIIASKYIVPFALFHIAVMVFRGASQRRHFEISTTRRPTTARLQEWGHGTRNTLRARQLSHESSCSGAVAAGLTFAIRAHNFKKDLL